MPTQSSPRSRRGPKPTLSREAVIEAALALADEQGLGALNLRRLASRLGISAMTPYSYFDDKADLLDAMVDHALAPLGLHATEGSVWYEELAEAMRGAHDALCRHPSVLELMMVNPETARLDAFRQERLDALMAAGLSREDSGDALRALTAYVLGDAVLRRLRRPSSERRHSADPFEHGVELLLGSIRRDAVG